MGSRQARGQSLVEMVLVAPLLVLILMIAGYIGLGMYKASLASEAIRQPSMKKMDMANSVRAINDERLLGYVQASKVKGTIKIGEAVDSVSVRNRGFQDEAAVIIGAKHFEVASFLPAFDFTVAQAVQSKLLQPAQFNAKIRGTGPWVPGGRPRTPPWMRFPNLPPGFDLNEGCSRISITPNTIRALDSDPNPRKVYLAVPEMPPNLPTSPIKEDSLMAMAATLPGNSCGDAAGVCQREYEHFLPDPDNNGKPREEVRVSNQGVPNAYVKFFTMKNPPGSPGLKAEYFISCDPGNSPKCKAILDEPRFERLPEIGPNHGSYFDQAQKYERPSQEMITSCLSRKKAECQLKEALQKANEIAAAFPDGCE